MTKKRPVHAMHIFEQRPQQARPQANLHLVQIVEERAPYLLLSRDDGLYAVVERRAGKFYSLHGGRHPEPMTDEGVAHAVGHDWHDATTAYALLGEITERYRDFAEHIW